MLLILFYMEMKIVFLLHGIDFQNFLFIVLITFKGVFAELDIVQFALEILCVISPSWIFLSCSFLDLHTIQGISKHNAYIGSNLM